MKSMGRWRVIIRERRLDSVQTSTTSPIKLRLVIISRRNWNSNDYSFFNSYAVNIYSCIHMNSCSSDPRQVPKKKLNLQKADGWEITTKPILDNLWSIPSTTTTQNSSSHRSFHSPSRLHSTYARRTDTLTSNKGHMRLVHHASQPVLSITRDPLHQRGSSKQGIVIPRL